MMTRRRRSERCRLSYSACSGDTSSASSSQPLNPPRVSRWGSMSNCSVCNDWSACKVEMRSRCGDPASAAASRGASFGPFAVPNASVSGLPSISSRARINHLAIAGVACVQVPFESTNAASALTLTGVVALISRVDEGRSSMPDCTVAAVTAVERLSQKLASNSNTPTAEAGKGSGALRMRISRRSQASAASASDTSAGPGLQWRRTASGRGSAVIPGRPPRSAARTPSNRSAPVRHWPAVGAADRARPTRATRAPRPCCPPAMVARAGAAAMLEPRG